jgi:hypothetical protein
MSSTNENNHEAKIPKETEIKTNGTPLFDIDGRWKRFMVEVQMFCLAGFCNGSFLLGEN